MDVTSEHVFCILPQKLLVLIIKVCKNSDYSIRPTLYNLSRTQTMKNKIKQRSLAYPICSSMLLKTKHLFFLVPKKL